MLTLLQSCDKQEVFSYESSMHCFLSCWKQVSLSERYRLDTVNYSFSHYVGVEDIEHQFKINLIGNLLEEDAEYKVIVVDSLTTATENQYTIKNPIFRKGRSSDSLSVVVHKTPALKDKSVHLTLRLVENENFRIRIYGLYGCTYSF